MALMGMTKTPTTRSATARLMMNKLETYFRIVVGNESFGLVKWNRQIWKMGEKKAGEKFESFRSGNKSIGSHLG